jgi:hypothetical protein
MDRELIKRDHLGRPLDQGFTDKPILCEIEGRKVYPGSVLYITWGDNKGQQFVPDRISGGLLAAGQYGCLPSNLSWSKPTEMLICPFCKDIDFDAKGLKIHFLMGWCEEYNKVDI